MSASTTANANANATNSPSSSPSTPLPPPAAAGAWCTPPRTPHSPTPASRSPPSSRSSLTGSLPSPHSNLPPSPDSPQMAPVSRSTPVTPITPLTVLSSSPSSPPSPSSVLVSSNLAVTPSALSPPSVHSPSSLASSLPPIPTPVLSSADTTSIPVTPSLGISTPSNPSSTQTTVTSLVDPPRSPRPSRVRFPPSLALGLGTSALSVSDAFTSMPIGSADSRLRAGTGTGLTVEEGLGLDVGLGLGERIEPQTLASPSPAGCIFSSSTAETIESPDSSLISSLSVLSLSLPVTTHSSLGREGRERERRDKEAKSSPRKERKGMGAGSGAANWRRNGAPSPAQIPKADAQRVSSVNPSANSHLKPRRPTQPQSQPRVLLAQTQTHTSLSTSSSTQRGQPSSPFSSPSKRARKERQSVVIVEESDRAIGGAEEARMDVDGGEGEERGGEGDMDVDTDGRRESGVQGDGEDEIEDWDSDSDSDDVEIYISGHGLEDLGSGLDPPPNAGGAIPADSPVLPCFPHRRHRYEKSGGSSGSVGAGAGVAGSPSIGDPTAGGQVCGGGQGQAGKRGGKSRSGSAASPTTALSKASPVTPSKDKKSKSPVTRATLASTLPSSITNSPGVNTATAAFPISSQVNTTSSSAHPAVNPTTPPINSTSFSNSSTSPSTSLSVQADSTPASGLLSPALPPAPTRQTIPLPEVDVGASFDVGFDGSMEFNRSAGLGTGVQLQSSPPTFDDCDASFVTCANEPSFGLDGNRNTADPDRTPRKAVPLAESTTKRSTSAWAPAHVSSASQLDINNLHSNAKPEAMKMGVPKKMKTNVNPHTNTHAKSNTNASGSGMSNNNLSLMINDTDESLMDVFDPVASSTPQSANATFEEEQEQEAEEESMYFDAQSGYQDVHGDGYQRNVEGRYAHMRRYGQSADTSGRGLGMVDVDMGGSGSRNANVTGNAGAHSSWRGGDEGWMEGSSRGGGRAKIEPSPTTSRFPSLTDSVFSLRPPHRPQHSQLPQQYIQHHDLQDENPTYEGPHSPVNYHPSNQNTLQQTSNSQQPQHNPHSEKTPNVYINGLPPHFPEDQLFALASPYGEIRSVRTFTRHVRDSESGYGFVLFETIDGAERCITALRKYRNLHPTFSKQIHKIPGTPYAHVQTPLQNALASSQSSDGGPAWEGACPGEESASFKAKMESLHDPTSTNLYMEGLPLSIDEPTLAALVAPHRINSSRFFQTRLSNPPRIIAFVRLETRAGAEEIVERLHGRMVRGWNDSGSRISVRFADTSEQRELRRAERAAKDGDPSPGRLTIAQAALLNLHGQDLRNKGTAAPVATPLRRGQARAEISPNTPYRALPSEYDQGKQKYDHTQPPFAVDYSLAPGRPKPNTSSPFRPYAPLPLVQLQIPSGPTITSIVDPLHGSDVPFHPNQECVDEYSGYDQQYLPDTQGLPSRHTKPAHTRTGYTAAEEYIMRAHAEALNLHAQAESFQQQQRRKPASLELIRHQEAGESAAGHRRDDSEDSVNITMGMRAYRAQASAIAYPSQHRQQQQRTSPAVRGRQLPNMSEEFHATASEAGCVQKQPNRLPQSQSVPKQMHNSNIHPPHVNARLGRGGDYMNDITSLQYQEERQQQTHYHNRQHSHQTQQYEHQQQQRQSPPQPFSPEVSEYDYHNTHTRSTTHPHRTTSNLHQHRHFQHNSMSVLSSNTSSNLSNNNMYNHGQQLADTIVNNDRSSVGNNTDINTNTNTYNYENSKPQTHLHRSSAYQDHPHQSSDIYDQSDSMPSPSFISPSLVSPSLTFSPHTPASTLSPATPFFGLFSSAAQIAEAFADRVQIGIGLGNPGGEDLMMQKNSKIRTESH